MSPEEDRNQDTLADMFMVVLAAIAFKCRIFTYHQHSKTFSKAHVCGKYTVSKEKQKYINKSCVFHLGKVKRAFQSGELNEEMVENLDETHFVFNMDSGKTLGLIGETKPCMTKY
jgi:hypothetical protein